jgi:hypothetical protein
MVNKKQVLISRPLKQDIPGGYCGAERPEEKDQGTTRQEVSLRQKTIPAQECVVLLVAVFFCSCLFLRYLCGAVRCGAVLPLLRPPALLCARTTTSTTKTTLLLPLFV